MVLRGDELGSLHGVPVSIKDLTPTQGIRTTFGSKLFEHHIPKEDALLVQRLKKAGAIILGKTNTPELGVGINTTNAVFGTTLNPWDFSRTCGGSSGGAAAALAAGLGPIAEGSDHGGSLRIPASFCGVIGFRTTPGRIPKFPSAWGWDFFSVTGPMARTVPDTALMLSVMAGPDDRVPISLNEPGSIFAQVLQGDMKGLRIAWSPDLGIALVDPEVVRICEQAVHRFESLGCTVEEACPDFSDIAEIIPPLRVYRSAAVFAQALETKMEGVTNAFFKEFLTLSEKMTVGEAARAETRRTELWLRVQRFFEDYDLLVCPTTQTTAFPVDQLFPKEIASHPISELIHSILLTYAITITTLPSISIPAGWTEGGLPVGLQITGKRFSEATVLRAAGALEQIAPWGHRRPNLP